MADDIAERVRRRAETCDCDGTCWTCQAADAIEARDAEIAQLRAEVAAERTANRITESHNHFDCAAHMARLRLAIDKFVAEVDGDHQPEWASEQAKANGKEPWCCVTCGPGDGSWPCGHRMALDELQEARRER